MLDVIAVTVCVNLSDILHTSLSFNKKYFKNYYVVTCPTDFATKNVCNQLNVQLIEYTDFNIDNAVFNKSGALKFAQNLIHARHLGEWILLLDADIVLTKEWFASLNYRLTYHLLNEQYLYSCSRYDVWSTQEFLERVKTRKYPIPGAGYMQLYYDKSKYYPSFSTNASKCDIDFALLFTYRQDIDPMCFVYHLGKENAHWNGAITINDINFNSIVGENV